MAIKMRIAALLKAKKTAISLKDRQHQSNNPAFIILSILVLTFNLSLFNTVIGWISLLVLCSVVIRCAIFFAYQKHIPTTRTLNLLALLSIVGLVYSAWPLGLLVAMVNLLVLACALKLMQVRTQRDFYQLVVSLLFLIGCGFIFNQSIIYSIFYVLLTLAVILSLGFFHAPNVATKEQIKRTLILSSQALPIGILLFLLLPQLPPLWQTPKAKSMETGLAESITPGDIARLSQSSDLAFRATFESQVPLAPERYWRAIVMEDFDGRTWRVHPERKQQRRNTQGQQQEFQPLLYGPYLDYDIIAEPTQQKWLYALDLATPLGAKSQAEIWQSDDFLLMSQQTLHSKYQYSVRSYPQAISYQTSNEFEQQLNLQIPTKGNPLTQKWLKQLRQQYPVDADLVNALLEYFRREQFIYTLRPSTMFIDPIDTFLFDKRAGFCSHYASALAYSLRLAGIPARVVAGYQGGELIAKSNQKQYLSVYQYDAHAWVEAWNKQSGWQRIDPTSLVAPDRLTLGLREAMLKEGSFLADSPFSLAKFTNIAVFNQLRLLLADLDYNWSRWVIGFNQQKQQEFFKSIVGSLTPQRLALLGLAILLLICLLLSLFFIPHWLNQRKQPIQACYQSALKLIQKQLGIRPIWQGPESFRNIVEQQLPTKTSQTFNAITEHYINALYKNGSPKAGHKRTSNQTVKTMKSLLKRLKKQLRDIPS
jgi:transglutaminase-like putative cysteine protease